MKSAVFASWPSNTGTIQGSQQGKICCPRSPVENESRAFTARPTCAQRQIAHRLLSGETSPAGSNGRFASRSSRSGSRRSGPSGTKAGRIARGEAFSRRSASASSPRAKLRNSAQGRDDGAARAARVEPHRFEAQPGFTERGLQRLRDRRRPPTTCDFDIGQGSAGYSLPLATDSPFLPQLGLAQLGKRPKAGWDGPAAVRRDRLRDRHRELPECARCSPRPIRRYAPPPGQARSSPRAGSSALRGEGGSRPTAFEKSPNCHVRFIFRSAFACLNAWRTSCFRVCGAAPMTIGQDYPGAATAFNLTITSVFYG
jgi:hypothetical protein